MSNDVNKLTVVLEGNSEKLQKALAAANQSMQKFDKQSKKVGGTNGSGGALGGILATAKKLAPALSAAFAVREIGMFGKEAIMLGAKLEGIKNAFQLIEDTGKTSLTELKKATRGAVDEMTLMGLAVQANNFKVPLENLGSFFEFATIRAAQTGESVEYLTRSIVTGIGRKSPLILDNLGITLVRLKEAMGKVGRESASVADISAAVSKIAKEETESLKMLGLTSTTTAQKLDKMTASFTNWKASLGKDVANSKDFLGILEDIGRMQDKISAKRLTEDLSEELGLSEKDVRNIRKKYEGKEMTTLEKDLKVLDELQSRLDGVLKTEKIKVSMTYGDVSSMNLKELIAWREESQKLFNIFMLPKVGDNSKEAQAMQALFEERKDQINDIAVAEEKLATDRAAFFDKYNKDLRKVKVEFQEGFIDAVGLAKGKQTILKDAITASRLAAEELGITGTEQFANWNKELDEVNAGLDDLDRKELLEKLAKKYKSVDPTEQEIQSLTSDPTDDSKSGEQLALESLVSAQNMYNEAVSAGRMTEKEADEARLGALENYIDKIYELTGVYDQFYIDQANGLKNTLFDKDKLKETSQMWSQMSSALGQLAGAFNPDSGIAKFLRLGQSIAAAAAAMAALGAVFDPTAPARSIGAAVAVAGALAGVVGSIGNISGGFGGNGGGAGYNAALASGGQLYTDIRGRDLRILLDREGKFSDRRGG